MRLSPLALLCACATAAPAPRPATVRASGIDPAECEGEAALACYDKGRQLLESRQPEVAQQSMEYVDQACSGGVDEACDLSDLAFKAPVKISGRNTVPPPSVRSQHIRGTVAVRCRLDTEGLLRDCEVLESVRGMDAEVLDSLSTRRYEPATWGGNPVEVPFDVRIDVTP
jgi:TonB family protein